MITNLPAIERTESILSQWENGVSLADIARSLSKDGVHSGTLHVMAKKVIADKNYSTTIDPIAIQRAWMGDRAVYENLTHYERAALTDKIVQAYFADGYHERWPGITPTEKYLGGTQHGWMARLARALGEEPDKFLVVAHRRKANAIKQAKKGPRKPKPLQEFCKRHHRLTPENRAPWGPGKDRCRTCKQERDRAYRASKRDVNNAKRRERRATDPEYRDRQNVRRRVKRAAGET